MPAIANRGEKGTVPMAVNRKGKDKRYYFSRAQMLLLGAAFTIASVIIFFLGMVVGKGIEERKIIKAEEPLMKIPVKPGEQRGGSAAASQSKEELTFYDTLTKSPAAAPLGEEKAKATKAQEKTPKIETKGVIRKGSQVLPQVTRVAAEKPANAAETAPLRKTVDKEKPAEKVVSSKPVEKKAVPQSALASIETAVNNKETGN